jgi:hypothetical protein
MIMKEKNAIIVLLLTILSIFLFMNWPKSTGMVVDKAELLLNNQNTTIIRPWDIVTVSITNEAANTNASTNQSYVIKVNSTSDPTGINIVVTETDANSSVFEGQFQAAEVTSSNVTSSTYPYPRINAADGDTVMVIADLGYGNVTEDSVTFDDRDEILLFRGGAPAGVDADAKVDNTPLYFNDQSQVFIVIYSKASASNPTTNVSIYQNASNNITVTLSEESSYPGKYVGNFTIDNSTASNSTTRTINATHDNSIRIWSDIGNDGESDDIIGITVDNVAPTFSSSHPENGSYIHNSTSQPINITLNEVHPKNRITIYYWRARNTEDADNDGVLDTGEFTTKSLTYLGNIYQVFIDDSSVPDNESVSFWIAGEDAAGNTFSAGSNTNPLVTFKIDNENPTLNIVNTDNEQVGEGMILRVQMNDTISGIASSNYTITNSSGAILKNGSIECTGNYCDRNETLTDLMDLPIGLLNLTVNVSDVAGNSVNSTLVINSTEAIKKRTTPVIISNTSVSNTGNESIVVEFNLSVKGSAIQVKLSDLVANSSVFNVDGKCSTTCVTLNYTKADNTTGTMDIYNTYNYNTTSLNDLNESTVYIKETRVLMVITIPEGLEPGNYTGTYGIKVLP